MAAAKRRSAKFTIDPESDAGKVFGHLDLGDKRRNDRFVAIFQAILFGRGNSLPDRLGNDAMYNGFLRLFDGPNLTHERLLEAQVTVTRANVANHGGTVLVLSDTTDADYSGQHSLDYGVGQIGNGGGRGFLLHHSLAIDPQSPRVA